MENSWIEPHPIFAGHIPADDPDPEQCMIHSSLFAALLEEESKQEVTVIHTPSSITTESAMAFDLSSTSEWWACERELSERREREFSECYEMINDMLNDAASRSLGPLPPPTPASPFATSPSNVSPPQLVSDLSDDWTDTDAEAEAKSDSDADLSSRAGQPMTLVPSTRRSSSPATPIATLLAQYTTPRPSAPILTTSSTSPSQKLKKTVHFHPSHSTRLFNPHSKSFVFESTSLSRTHRASFEGCITTTRRANFAERGIKRALGISLSTNLGFSDSHVTDDQSSDIGDDCNISDIDADNSNSNGHADAIVEGTNKLDDEGNPLVQGHRLFKPSTAAPTARDPRYQRVCVRAVLAGQKRGCSQTPPTGTTTTSTSTSKSTAMTTMESHLSIEHVSVQEIYSRTTKEIEEQLAQFVRSVSTTTPGAPSTDLPSTPTSTTTTTSSTSSFEPTSHPVPGFYPPPNALRSLILTDKATTITDKALKSMKNYLRRAGMLDSPKRMASCPDEFDVQMFAQAGEWVREKLGAVLEEEEEG